MEGGAGKTQLGTFCRFSRLPGETPHPLPFPWQPGETPYPTAEHPWRADGPYLDLQCPPQPETGPALPWMPMSKPPLDERLMPTQKTNLENTGIAQYKPCLLHIKLNHGLFSALDKPR